MKSILQICLVAFAGILCSANLYAQCDSTTVEDNRNVITLPLYLQNGHIIYNCYTDKMTCIRILIDTGACKSICYRESILKRVYSCSNQTFTGFGGKETTVNAYGLLDVFGIQTRCYLSDNPGVQYDVILGLDFLHAHSAEIDLGEMCLRLYNYPKFNK